MKTDWCTAWPDSLGGYDWSHCCAVHDIAYLMDMPRVASDLRLGACVADVGVSIMGVIMAAGVFCFGVLFRKKAKARAR